MIKRKALYFILVLTFIFAGCKKNVFDYRNKYTGRYDIEYTSTSWDINQGSNTSGPHNYTGEVYYHRNTEDEIKIGFKPGSTATLKIDKEGTLYSFCGSRQGAFEGRRKFSVSISSNMCPGGSGLGGGTSYSVEGSK